MLLMVREQSLACRKPLFFLLVGEKGLSSRSVAGSEAGAKNHWHILAWTLDLQPRVTLTSVETVALAGARMSLGGTDSVASLEKSERSLAEEGSAVKNGC